MTPPNTQFVDGTWSCIARLLPFMEGGAQFNTLNFSTGYNDRTGMNSTGASSVISIFLCPSATRQGAGNRDGTDPDDKFTQVTGGYGFTDYGNVAYVDISPVLANNATAFPPTPFRDKTSRMSGMLKAGMTRIAEILDGTSNTIAIGEDAGRDARFVSPYTQGYIVPAGAAAPSPPPYNNPVNIGSYRRYWRWAEPDCGFGVSGQPNNKYRPMNEATAFPTSSRSGPRATTPAPTTSCSRSTPAA